jgi:hypothetical protein
MAQPQQQRWTLFAHILVTRVNLFNALTRMIIAVLVLGTFMYVAKGRERGLPLWAALVTAGVVIGINVVAGLLSDRNKDD